MKIEVSDQMSIHVVRCTPAYWYAEVKSDVGARLVGRGGFDSEAGARAWAHQAAEQRRVEPLADR